jgi:predicted alpha/beta hydrolase family esterase
MTLQRNAILLHGKPKQEKYENPDFLDPSDSHWIPWAKHQLNIHGIFSVAPDLPKPYDPKYAAWAREFERHDASRDTTVIAHSAGAGFILKWLNSNGAAELDKLVLVAPWLDPQRKYRPEFDFGFRHNLTRRVGSITVFHSSLDDDQALASLDIVQRELPDATYIDIPKYGHYMLGNAMESVEFDELIDSVI